MPGIEDLFAGSAPQSQPVLNATTQGNAQQAQNVLNQARQVQAAQGAQDIGMKQRAMQLSMLNGVMALPPEKQSDALANIVPMMNRLGPTQFDENMTPDTARMFMMSQVPAEQMPQYNMMTQQAGMYNTIRQIEEAKARAAGLGSPVSPTTGGTPMPQGTPMPANGVMQPGGGAPVPQGGGAPINAGDLDDAETHLMTVVNPASATAQIGEKRLQLENNPQQQAALESAKTSGKNQAENQLQASKADQLTQRLQMNLNAMLALNEDVPTGGFVPTGTKSYLSQGLAANKGNVIGNMAEAAGADTSGKGAIASSQWDQLNNQQILSEIQQFIATGGANTRTNQTLERIVNAASGIDKNALPAQREAQLKNALAEIQNKNVSIQNLAGGNKEYQKIPINSADSNAQKQRGGQQAGSIVKSKNGVAFLFMGGDPTDPKNYKPASANGTP